MRRQEDHRQPELLLDVIGERDAVDQSVNPDVHQQQVRAVALDHCERRRRRIRDGGDGVSQPQQALFEVGRDQRFVFHDHDSFLRFQIHLARGSGAPRRYLLRSADLLISIVAAAPVFS